MRPSIHSALLFRVICVAGCIAPTGADDGSETLLSAASDPSDAFVSEPRKWVGAGSRRLVYDTATAHSPARYINDHCVIKALDGTWHMFGITADRAPPGVFPNGGLETKLAHATAPAIEGPWTTQPDVLHRDPSYFGEVHVWAPHVIESGGTYYMFYAAGAGTRAAINLATSTDLFTWTRIPSGPLFRDGVEARDPFVVRVGNQWVMYYCATSRPDGGDHVVAYRTSTDLVHWGDRKIAYTDPTNTGVVESPAVVQHDGLWFLFLGPVRSGYIGTDAYRSADPFHFETTNYAGHVPVHAAEVVQDGDAWWVTGAGSFHRGLYVAPLRWQREPPPWQSPQNPALARDLDGRLFAFSVSTDGKQIQYRQQASANGVWDRDWQPFGATAEGVVPTVRTNASGRLQVFALGPNGGAVLQRAQASASSWGDWETFAGPTGAAPAVSLGADGRLEAFALTPAGASIVHRNQDRPGGTWSAWESFGGPAGAPPVVARNADGRLEVFALGPAGAYVAHRWQDRPNGPWSAWHTFSGPVGSAPVIANEADGRLSVFVVGIYGGAIFRRTQTVPSGGWGNWEPFSGWVESVPTVAQNADGRLEAFVLVAGGEVVMHRWQNRPNGTWSEWHPFGGPGACSPSVAADATGRLHVFLVKPDGSVDVRVQTAPSSGWNEWQPFSGPVSHSFCGSPT